MFWVLFCSAFAAFFAWVAAVAVRRDRRRAECGEEGRRIEERAVRARAENRRTARTLTQWGDADTVRALRDRG